MNFKIAIIHPSIRRCRKFDDHPSLRRFSQIWLYTRYEVQFKKKKKFLFSTLHHTEKPTIEICQFKLLLLFLSLILKGSSKHFQNHFNLDIFQLKKFSLFLAKLQN
jgi:hypothetical protein